jgi:tyrosine-protein phosphatase non-receptor type 4
MQLLVDQNEENEQRIAELHKLHRGQMPADAELNYLEHAKRLDMYGIDFHSATDSSGKEIMLGVSSIGLLVYQHSIRKNTFSWSKMVKVSFKRKDFFIQLRREPSESYDTLLGFSMGSHKNAKALWKSCVEHHSFFRLQKPHRSPRFLPLTLGSKFHYSGRTELQAVQESRQRVKVSKVFVRSPSRRLISSPLLNGGSDISQNGQSNGKSSILSKTRPHDNKVSTDKSVPRKAWEQGSDDEGGFIDRCPRTFEQGVPPLFDSPPAYESSENTSKQTDEGLVTIRLVADEQGRFGFNVKGGVDHHNMPILVSRVAPHTPADRSNPRIDEGDQVLMINGHDVSGLKHEQVVNLIRNSRDNELILTIKPNALVVVEEEPLYQYVPENSSDLITNPQSFTSGSSDANLFTQSLLLLSDGLASGALFTQYEQLYRKNPDLAITDARKPENANKNRYRDISPCMSFLVNLCRFF